MPDVLKIILIVMISSLMGVIVGGYAHYLELKILNHNTILFKEERYTIQNFSLINEQLFINAELKKIK